MINLHVHYPNEHIDFNAASQLALARARASNFRQPAIVSWHRLDTHEFSPAFAGADEASWWAKYGLGNGGQIDVSVGEDYEFIIMETGGYETLYGIPLSNLHDEAGNEYVCLTPLLDDSRRPRQDACAPLDEWMADQY